MYDTIRNIVPKFKEDNVIYIHINEVTNYVGYYFPDKAKDIYLAHLYLSNPRSLKYDHNYKTELMVHYVKIINYDELVYYLENDNL